MISNLVNLLRRLPDRHPTSSILILFCVASLTRLVFIHATIGFQASDLEGDAEGYVTLANKIVGGQEYSDGVWGRMWRTPGYPVFLSLIFRLPGSGLANVRLVQSLLGGLVCVLIYVLGKTMLSDPTLGFWSGLYFAFYPPHVWIAGQMLSENVSIPLLLAITLSFTATHRPWEAIAWGTLLGISALVRPETGGIVVVLLLLLLVLPSASIRRRSCMSALVMISMLLVVSPWLVRNYSLSGRIVMSTVGGEAFWGGNNEYTLNHPEWRGYWKLTDDLRLVLAEPNELDRDQLRWKLGIEFLQTHKRDLPRLAYYKLSRFYSVMLHGKVERLVMVISFGILLPFVFIGICGTFVTMVRQRSHGLIMHGTVIYYNLLAIVFWGSNRFRLVIDPFLIMSGLWAILGIIRVRGGRSS